MTIKGSYSFPRYFQVPLHGDLVKQVERLSSAERQALEGTVYQLAKVDGVRIEDWDIQWGRHHLLDSDGRLTAAMLEQRKAFLQMKAGCSKRVADLVVRYCPLVTRPDVSLQVLEDLICRAQCLSRLEIQKERLNAKYLALDLCGPDSDEMRNKGWRAQETFLLTIPALLTEKEKQRFDYFTSVVQELIVGNYDLMTVAMILDRLLLRESTHVTSSNFANHLRLLEIKNIAQRQIADCTLSRGDESFTKAIFVVPSVSDKQGKVKPLHPRCAIKEAYAYRCDHMLGIGMTAPTMRLTPGNFARRVEPIRKLLETANVDRIRGNVAGAERHTQRAFALLNASDFPAEARNAIFEEMYYLCGDNQLIDDLGKKLFFDLEDHATAESLKTLAVRNYQDSPKFMEHMQKFGLQGSVQIWLNHCSKRAYEYIVQDPQGGEKLKAVPKVLTHFYALLGILKGSMDCSSGNTLIEFHATTSRVANFWDMDDERSMPATNNWWNIRLWEMGLPQCSQPFDRACLLLFSDPALLIKLQRLQSSPLISSSEYRRQFERLETIIALFKVELQKPVVTLTPRNLFFKIFGGEEHYKYVKEGFNSDKSQGEEGIRISSIELFEFHLPEMGRTAWYTEDEQEKRNITANMRALYFPELP